MGVNPEYRFPIFEVIMPTEIYIDPVVAQVYELHQEVIDARKDISKVSDWLVLMAKNLFEEHQKGNQACIVELSNYYPGLIGKQANEVLNYPLREDEAKLTIALEYGFTNISNIHSDLTFDENFEQAVDHLVNGEQEKLLELTSVYPNLVTDRSPFGHHATLLHYAASNGVEVWRQKVPKNLPELVCDVIQAGADREATANIYNGAYTTAELAGTSGHPLAAGILTKLIDALVK